MRLRLPVILPLLLILLLPWLLTSGVPFRSDGAGGENPKGGVHGCTPFFYATWMSRRKIPSAEWTRSAAGTEGAEAGACFLLVTSLCTSKEK
ncbi:hypothetical protein CQ393_09890 [Stenotrophomonas sp. MYb238]|nr:hypothetical protein [Stenotrophomonas sp. MYb238]